MSRNQSLNLATTDSKEVSALLQRESDRLASLIPSVVDQTAREIELANDILDYLNGEPGEDGEPKKLPPGVDQASIKAHLMRVSKVREMTLKSTGLYSSAPQNTFVMAQISGTQQSPINERVLAAVSQALKLPQPDIQEAEVIE